MHYIAIVVELLATFIEAFMCMVFSLTILNKSIDFGKNAAKISLCSVIYTALIAWCNTFHTVSPFITFITVILFTAINMLITRKDYISCAIVSVFFVIFQANIEMIIICLISVIMNDPNYVFKILQIDEIARIVLIIAVKSLLIATYLAAKNRLIDFNNKILHNPIFIIFMIIYLTITIKMIAIIAANNLYKVKIGVSILFVSFILAMLLILYLFDRLLKEQKENEFQSFLIMKNNLLENNLRYINKLYNDNSKNFHEFKHHISTLAYMFKNKQYKNAESYFNDINITNDLKSYFLTGNDIVDIILNVEHSKLKDMNIDCNIVVDVPKKIGHKGQRFV